MNTYYIYQEKKDGRWIIDTGFPSNAHRVADSRQASEWLEAKKLFGYELTPIQQWLLNRHQEARRAA